MKGYKATDANMTCRDFQFNLDTEYTHAGEIYPCASGFHFCPKLEDVFCYYNAPNIRIYEVEATGEVIPDGNKCVTDKIKFVRELPIEEIYEQCQHKWQARRIAAYRQYKLNVLVEDKDWEVRYQIAKQGYALDILINDRDGDVRIAAKQYNSVGANLSRFVSKLFHR